MSLNDRRRVGLDPSDTVWDVFVSYASLDTDRVAPLVFALRRRGLKVWWDVDRIDTFDGITARLEEGISGARVVLACLSETYPTRAACQHEAFEVLRRLHHEHVSQRLLTTIVTPGALTDVWPVLTDLRAEKRLAEDPGLGMPDIDAVADIIADHLQAIPTTPIGPTPARSVEWWPHTPARHASFESRTNEMLHLHSMLVGQKNLMDHGQAGPIRPAVVAAGMGGIGKTMLVGQYLLNTADAWPGGVIRIDCGGDRFGHYVGGEDPRLLEYVGEQLADYLAEHGQAIPESRADASPIRAARSRLRALRHQLREYRLAHHQPPDLHRSVWWLDDLPSGVTTEDLALISSPMPESTVTVVTTRDNRYAQSGWSVGLTELSSDKGQAILEHYRDQPGADCSEDERAIPGIVEALGGHPLALDVIGALRKERRSKWLQLLTLLRSDTLAKYEATLGSDQTNQLAAGHVASIRLTLTASMQHLTATSPQAADLVMACSLLLPGKSLPKSLLADVLGWSKARLAASVGDAARLNLVSHDSSTVAVHALVAGVSQGAENARDSSGSRPTAIRSRLFSVTREPRVIIDIINAYGVDTGLMVLDASDPKSLLARMVRTHRRTIENAIPIADESAVALTWAALRYGRPDLAGEFRAEARARGTVQRPLPLWTTERISPALVSVLRGHSDAVTSVAFADLPGGQVILATGGRDNALCLWDTTGRPLAGPWEEHRDWISVISSTTMPDGRAVLATGSGDATVRVWNLVTGRLEGAPLEGHTKWISAIAFVTLAGGTIILATGSADNTVMLWDLSTSQPVDGPLRGHDRTVSAIVSTRMPDGSTVLATGSWDSTICLWDPATGRPLREPLQTQVGPIDALSVCVLPGGDRCVIVLGRDGTVQRWSLTTGQALDQPSNVHGRATSTIAWTATDDGRVVVASGKPGSGVSLWDPFTGRPVGEVLRGHTDEVTACAFTMATGIEDGCSTLSDFIDDDSAFLDDCLPSDHGSGRRVAALRAGDLLVATGSDDSTARLWNPGAPGLTIHVGRHTRAVSAMKFVTLSDGRLLLATGSWDTHVRLWDPLTGDPVGKPLRGHTDWISAMASARLENAHTVIAAGSGDNTALMWDVATGEPHGDPLIGHERTIAAMDSKTMGDGSALLASGSWDTTIRLWEANTGRPVGDPLKAHDAGVCALAFGDSQEGDDGVLLATGDYEGTVCIWDARSGQRLHQWHHVHRGPIRSITFTRSLAGGAQLASVSRDGTTSILDAATGRILLEYPILGGQRGAVRTAQVKPVPHRDSLMVIAGTDQGPLCWEPTSTYHPALLRAGENGPVFAVDIETRSDGTALLATACAGDIQVLELA